MNRLPTMSQLNQMGTDAWCFLRMRELHLELAVDNACTPHGRAVLQTALRRLRKRRAEYFGPNDET